MQNLIRRRRAAEANIEKQKNLLKCEQRLSQKDKGKKDNHCPKCDHLTDKVDKPSSHSMVATSSIPEELLYETRSNSAATKSSIRVVATSTPSSEHARNQMSYSANGPLEPSGVMEHDNVTMWSEGKLAWTCRKLGIRRKQ